MSEKKTVLLQLGSLKDAKMVGQIDIVKEDNENFIVAITLDQDHDGRLVEALKNGSVTFAGRIPTVLDFYSDKDAWMPKVREQLS